MDSDIMDQPTVYTCQILEDNMSTIGKYISYLNTAEDRSNLQHFH
jgi:hypothetical protein